jgi:hypothetical protein
VAAIETIDERARIVTAQRDSSYYDAVVVAAGAGTPRLPPMPACSYPTGWNATYGLRSGLKQQSRRRAGSNAVRVAIGFTSYSQLTSPTTWAIGAGLPPAMLPGSWGRMKSNAAPEQRSSRTSRRR